MVTVPKRFYFSKNVCSITRGIASLISLDVNDSSGIATVSFQKPPANIFNLEFFEELSTKLSNLENEKVKGLILTAKKDGIFSGGLDLNEIYKQPDLERMRKYWTILRQAWIKLYTASYPTVAVINGHAPAGACLFSLACEYRIMTKNYRIGGNETLVGLVAPKWFMDRMSDIIGRRQTEMAFTTGHLFTTEEALAVGLVDEMVENKDEGTAKAEAFIKRFDQIPSLARYLTKKCIRGETLDKMIREEEEDTDHFVRFNSTPDTQRTIEEYLGGLKNRPKK